MRPLIVLCTLAILASVFGVAQTHAQQGQAIAKTYENGGAQLQEGLNALVARNFGRAHVLCTEAERKLAWHTAQNYDFSYDYDSGLGPWMKSAKQCQADALFYLNQKEQACEVYARVGYTSTGGGDMAPMCREFERQAAKATARSDDAHELMGQLNRRASSVTSKLTSGQQDEAGITEYERLCETIGQHDGISRDMREGIHAFCRGQAAYYRGQVDMGCQYFQTSEQALRRVAHGRDKILSGDDYLSAYGDSFYQQAQHYIADC